MHPADCPKWEYENDARRPILARRIAEIVAELSTGTVDTGQTASDSRAVHARMFRELTPTQHEYYAGHYRGECFKCLEFYAVGVQGDNRVGTPPSGVAFEMRELGNRISALVNALDQNILLKPEDRVRYVVAAASSVFVRFLTIHPYFNGNGHAGRLIIWSLLLRYGYTPQRWTIEPGPEPRQVYLDLIKRHRSGNVEPLEMQIWRSITSPQSAPKA
jgi:fido (protein-threonine AMPylation protein)